MMYIYSIYDNSSGESFFPEFAPDDTTYIERIKYRIKNHAGWKVLYEENQAKPGKYVLRINGVFVKSTGMVYNENPDNEPIRKSMKLLLNEWSIRLGRATAIAIAICFGFLLGYYYCERSIMFDDIKHGIYMNEQAIQKNTEMIKQIYKKYEK